MSLLRTVCLGFFLLGHNSLADEPIAETVANSEPAKSEEKMGHGFAPLLGFEPTYRFVLGAAYFYEQERFSLAADVNTNFSRVYQFHSTVRHEIVPKWYYKFHTSFTQGFQPYYGEGGETQVASFARLWGTHGHSKLEFAYRITPIFSLGIYGDARYRTEEVKEDSLPYVVFPNETTLGIGLFQQIDARDNKLSPREGFVFRTDIVHIPPSFTTSQNIAAFSQMEGSFIVYKEILNQVVRDVIAAFHLMGGYTLGNPTYTYAFRLGGADRLRGYHENRFRGKNYYLQQTELRFPIWKLFSGAAFLGFGDSTNGDFTFAKMSYGVGIRIGLPPDWVSKLRIDLGVGRDQSGIFADFGHTF